MKEYVKPAVDTGYNKTDNRKRRSAFCHTEVDTFTAQLSQNNVDYQPVGSALVYAVPTGYSVTLTLTEAVVRDDVMIEKFLDDIKQGYVPVFDFQGKLRRRDGQSSRHIYKNCLPDGTIDLMNLTPGDIIKRNWSFRVNAIPEYLEGFRYDVE